MHGIRSEDALESAIAQPMNVWYYGTSLQAALDFLRVNGIDTDALPEVGTHESMIRVANHELDWAGLAEFLRETLRSV